MFLGKKALKVSLSMQFKKESIYILSTKDSRFESYNFHYPALIDRNMNIISDHDVYLNIPKQMLDFIEDTKKILKLVNRPG